MFGSSFQETALHLAAHDPCCCIPSWHFSTRHVHAAVYKLLIAGKADVNAANMCAFAFQKCYWSCVQVYFRSLLLMFCSSGQRTALHRAANAGHAAACELLIANKADVNAKGRCAFMFKICD